MKSRRSLNGLGHVHRFLAGHGVGHEEFLLGLEQGDDAIQFLHQFVVDLQAAGGIVDDHVVPVVLGELAAVLGDLHRIAQALVVHGDAQGLADGLELVDGGGAVHVAGHHQGILLAGGAQVQGQLAAGRGLARTLQAHHQDLERRGALEQRLFGLAAQQVHQFVVQDLDHHLARGQGLEHVGPDRLFLDGIDEVLDGLEVHVGGEQSHPDFPEGLGHVLFGQLGLAAQALENAFELIGKLFEHGFKDKKYGGGRLGQRTARWAVSRQQANGANSERCRPLQIRRGVLSRFQAS